MPAHECGRRFFGFGCRGKTGVTGIARGGDLGGRLAACLASASVMKLLLTGLFSVLRDDCLNGCAFMGSIVSKVHVPVAPDAGYEVLLGVWRLAATQKDF
jgi:hypothetical protein